jgi:hypothetical protein
LLSENRTVITLTEPQVWVLIGVFSAALFGMIGIITTSFNRTLTASIEGLRDTMNAKFETVNVRLDSMDRDIQALSRHVFGADPR